MTSRSRTPDSCTRGCCGGGSMTPSVCSVDGEAGITSDMNDTCKGDERCDEDCVKTAAAIECSIACTQEKTNCCEVIEFDVQSPKGKDPVKCNDQGDNAHRHIHSENGQHLDEPCSMHLQAAIARYAEYLESARCICRSVLERVQRVESCTTSTTLVTPCTTAYTTAREHPSTGQQLSYMRSRKSLRPLSVQKDGLAKSENTDTCGSSVGVTDCIEMKALSREVLPEITDLERAEMTTHVLLNVTGMDCSGCADNLTRAIQGANGTSNVRVSFISGIVEFDLDIHINSLDKVIRYAQRATRYKLTPSVSNNQTIEVNITAETAADFRRALPRGVDSCDKTSKTTHEISYDPWTIGVRDILALLGEPGLADQRADRVLEAGRQRLIRIATSTLAAFGLTVPVVALEWGSPAGVSENTALVISLVLASFVQLIAIREFYIPAGSALIYNKVVEMDMLVVIGITAAYVYSMVAAGLKLAGTQLETKPFFETSTLLVTLILLGRLLAAWARKRAVSAVSVRSLQAATAVLVDQASGETKEIDARLLQFGDTIRIPPHSKIVSDGHVIHGASEVDESMLTGESLPVLKSVGSSVIAGTINGEGSLTAQILCLPGKNTITDIADLVENAQRSKPRVQEMADKVAGYFVPVVTTASIIVCIIWLVVGLKAQNLSGGSAIGLSIGYSIAVLAVSCPCALGLAVPMVLVVASGIAARGGIIIKTADVVERCFKVTDVVFDKTGTLTQPDLELVEESVLCKIHVSKSDVYSLIFSMIRGNKHPVSEALLANLTTRNIQSVELTASRSLPGRGIEAEWNGMTIRVGNARWLGVQTHPQVAAFTSSGLTVLCVAIDGDLQAIFGLKSTLRPETISVVRNLQQRGVSVHIVSGDNRKVVEEVAVNLGISFDNIAAERNPAQKQDYLKRLKDSGKITLFCGDGTNDAVAVAQADVGVQINSASDVTRATADVVLLSDLNRIVNLMDLSKAAFRRIVFNFAWSAIYNCLAILLAGGAFVKIRIPPAYAGLGEIVSVMPVIIAAMTMPKTAKASAAASN